MYSYEEQCIMDLADNYTLLYSFLGRSLIDAFGSSNKDGREIHLQDENTGEPIVFEVREFVPSPGVKPAAGDVMKFVWLKDGGLTYTNLTRHPKMRNYAP